MTSSPFDIYKKIFNSTFYFYIVYIILDCLYKFLFIFYNATHDILRFFINSPQRQYYSIHFIIFIIIDILRFVK